MELLALDLLLAVTELQFSNHFRRIADIGCYGCNGCMPRDLTTCEEG